MTYPVPETRPLGEQPVEYVEEKGDLFFRAVCLKKGTVIPQHSHKVPHVTLVASGAARLWVDGEYVGDYKGFCAIEIEAERAHLFQALEDNTRLACVFIASRAEYASLLSKEH